MSSIHVAHTLLNKIEAQISGDQGNAYRGYLEPLVKGLDDAFRQSKYKFRPHMGASLQGNACARAIWYNFRWFTVPKFSGRIQRLFNRGHMEEARFIAALQCADVSVWQYDDTGKQFAIKGSYGHYGGSGDGLCTGLPDVPEGIYGVSEFKTHNSKSFAELLKLGMKKAKWEHYVQMQQYQVKFDMPMGLYMAVNKDTDELYAEYIQTDREVALRAFDRADKIIWMDRAPPQIGNPPSAGNFACRFCDHKPVCHQGAKAAVNCRTCTYSEPLREGDPIWGPDGGKAAEWHCRLHNARLDRDRQEEGCGSWIEIKA